MSKLRYMQLNPECVTRGDKLKAELENKYGKKTFENLQKNGNEFLLNHMRESIKTGKLGSELDVFQSDENTLTAKIVNKVKEIVTTPENYIADFFCCIYMGLGYYILSNEFKMLPEAERDRMESVLSRASNEEKIDKEEAKRRYPDVLKKVNGELGVRGGCVPFHCTMISLENFGMFDLQTDVKSLKRYSYMRAYGIYEKLKETSMENWLLSEMCLGVGYSNYLYSKLKSIESAVELQDKLEAIKYCTEIEPFFIRKKIIEAVLETLEFSTDPEEVTNKWLNEFLKEIKDLVGFLFEEYIDLWWNVYVIFGKKRDAGFLGSVLKWNWLNYYNDDDVHKDHMEHCKVHDWRSVNTVQDCFGIIPNFTILENVADDTKDRKLAERQYKNVEIGYWTSIEQIGLKDKVLLVEKATNEIGQTILETVEKRFYRMELPANNVEAYKEFYRMREKIYGELRMNDKKRFDVDVKKPKKLKCIHSYAIIHYEVMKALLM